MPVKFSALALRQIEDIWLYSEEKWGATQAESYVDGLFDMIEGLPGTRHLWRAVPHDSLREARYARYRAHFVFFRQFSDTTLGIIAVLHQRQNIPRRLQELS